MHSFSVLLGSSVGRAPPRYADWPGSSAALSANSSLPNGERTCPLIAGNACSHWGSVYMCFKIGGHIVLVIPDPIRTACNNNNINTDV